MPQNQQSVNDDPESQLSDVMKRRQNLGIAHDAAVLGDMVEMLRMNRAKDRAASRNYNGETDSMPDEGETQIHVGDIYQQGIDPVNKTSTSTQPPVASENGGKLSPLVAGTLGVLAASIPMTGLVAYLAARQPTPTPIVDTDTDTRNTIRPYVPRENRE